MSTRTNQTIHWFDSVRLFEGLARIFEYAQGRFELVMEDGTGHPAVITKELEQLIKECATLLGAEADTAKNEANNKLNPFIRLRMDVNGEADLRLDLPDSVRMEYDAALVAIDHLVRDARIRLIQWLATETRKASLEMPSITTLTPTGPIEVASEAGRRNPLIPNPPSLTEVFGYLWIGRRKIGMALLCTCHAIAAVKVFNDHTLAVEYLLFWGLILAQRDAWSRHLNHITKRIVARRRRITRLLFFTIIWGTIIGCVLKVTEIIQYADAHDQWSQIVECLLHGSFHLMLAFLMEDLLSDVFGDPYPEE